MSLDTIIQYAITRSGSTLVVRTLKNLFPEAEVTKTHSFVEKLLDHPIVGTYRDPRDVIVSLWRTDREKLPDPKRWFHEIDTSSRDLREPLPEVVQMTDQEVVAYVHRIRSQFGILQRYVSEARQITWLRYEEFAFNPRFLFDKLDTFFEMVTPTDRREAIWSSISVDETLKIQERLKNFSEVDINSRVHGHHIGPFRGQPGKWTEFMSAEAQDYVREQLSDLLKAFSYE